MPKLNDVTILVKLLLLRPADCEDLPGASQVLYDLGYFNNQSELV